MTAFAIGSSASSLAALTLLRQGPITPQENSAADTLGAPFRYDGSLTTGVSAAAYTIDTILRSRAIAPPASSAAGLAQLAGALARFDSAGVSVQFRVDGAAAPDDVAGWMGDRNIGILADHAASVAATPEEALAQYGEIARQAAARPGASDFSKQIHQAYLEGRIELVPAEEYGVKSETAVAFHFAANGDFRGSSWNVSTPADSLSLADLKQTRLKEQDDGSWIDTETGRYAAGISFGGRSYVATFD
ncbi:hypothetical protein HNE_3420 [Hyphomonas neptunium ATCC 15444]|uniref:Uncharacterized protein n=2 Tax=Hyphomonas TaxID=85 RepID=Q0BWQ0_HYPNA|nr:MULTISPECIES: hypothetical protein [Hyphomonas]ABI75392.1 hypothetical protein HNE_3420 [Hyphomonas neptunium ATCC 15444]KCZ91908.1 hypothetical protein HHI_11784 [Hyphomonas hirschiana VP5]